MKYLVSGMRADGLTPKGAAMDTLLTAIMLWLCANYGLAEYRQHPQVEVVPHSHLIAVKHGPIGDFIGSSGQTDGHHPHLAAIYDDAARKIYLPDGWTGQTAADLSVLVHEMVHHLQNTGGMRYPCPQARERLAYEAQDQWLRLYGTSLETEFGIDPMTRLVRTTCAN